MKARERREEAVAVYKVEMLET
jgi:hypothetical protein